MSQKTKASDLLAKMRKVTGSGAPVAVAQVVPVAEPIEQEPEPLPLPETPSAPAKAAGKRASRSESKVADPKRAKPIRYSLDLSPEQHRFLKRFALEANVDSSVVMRKLLELLEQDERLARRGMEWLSD
jgi:hypothetical protein